MRSVPIVEITKPQDVAVFRRLHGSSARDQRRHFVPDPTPFCSQRTNRSRPNRHEVNPNNTFSMRDADSVIARSDSDEAIHASADAARWIASRSLSSGARWRDPLARNDGIGALFAIRLHFVRKERIGIEKIGAKQLLTTGCFDLHEMRTQMLFADLFARCGGPGVTHPCSDAFISKLRPQGPHLAGKPPASALVSARELVGDRDVVLIALVLIEL